MKQKSKGTLIFTLFLVVVLVLQGCIDQYIPSQTTEELKQTVKNEKEAQKVQTFDAIAVWQGKYENDKDWNIYYSLYDDTNKKWFTYEGGTSSLISKNKGDEFDPDVYSYPEKGFAIAVWENKDEEDIYFSAFNGRNWTVPQKIPFKGKDHDPTVAIGKEKIFIAWVNERENNRRIYYLSFNYEDLLKGKPLSLKPGYIETAYYSTLPEAEVFNNDQFGLIFITGKEKPVATFALISDSVDFISAIPYQTSPAIFDSTNPKIERTGISGGEKGLYMVWKARDGIYGAFYNGTLSKAKKYEQGNAPDVDNKLKTIVLYSKDSQNFIYDFYRKLKIDSSSKDRRVSLTTLNNKNGRQLAVFFEHNKEGQYISYSVYDPNTNRWENPANIDGETIAINPAAAPWINRVEFKPRNPYCGDGNLDIGEQCEAGIACKNPTDKCNLATCTCEQPVEFCGDGVLDPFTEDCEVGIPCLDPADKCDLTDCSCYGENESEPPFCGDGFLDIGEQCEVGIPCGNPALICNTNTCQCYGFVIPGGDYWWPNLTEPKNDTPKNDSIEPKTPKNDTIQPKNETPKNDTIQPKNDTSKNDTVEPGNETETPLPCSLGPYESPLPKVAQPSGYCVDDCPEGYYCTESCSCEKKDTDGDGIPDDKDNCVNKKNPDQEDVDEDRIGDACDKCIDVDHDGVCDDKDNCPSVYNPKQEDDDGDGIGSHCDSTPINCASEIGSVAKDANSASNIVVVLEGKSISASSCANAVSQYFEVQQCTLTCKYSFIKTYAWYSNSGKVNSYACCYGAVKYQQCSDCPGQNPQCPSQESCSQYNPFINSG